MLLTCVSAISTFGQQAVHRVRTLVVMRSENRFKTTGLLVSEAFPEVLHPSQATLYCIAEEIGGITGWWAAT